MNRHSPLLLLLKENFKKFVSVTKKEGRIKKNEELMENGKLKIVLVIAVTVFLIVIPFIIKVTNYEWYLEFKNYFFPKEKFISGIDLYISMIIMILTGAGIITNFLVLKFYLKSHNDILKQNERINKENSSPIVTLKIIQKNGLLYLKLKNSGNSPAFDINIKFSKEIKYPLSEYSTLNKLPIFERLSLLEKGEEIIFYFDSAKNFYSKKENNSLEVETTISFKDKITDCKKRQEYKTLLSFKEYEGMLYIHEVGLKDIVKKMDKLSHSLIINFEHQNKRDK